MFKLQSPAQQRSILARAIVSIVDKKTPLTAEDRARLTELRAKMDDLEPAIATQGERKYAAAFRSYLRQGFSANPRQCGISGEERSLLLEYQKVFVERRDLGTGGQSAYPGALSGFFAPTDFSGYVESAEKYYGPMLDATSVVDTQTGAPMGFPADNDATISGEQVAESTQVTAADIPISEVTLKSYKFSSKLVKMSLDLVQDAGFPLDVYLAERFGIRLARAINLKLTTGSGTGEPTGFVTAATAAVTAVGSSGNDGSAAGANTIGTDDLVNLELAVDPAYRLGAAYMMHANTLATLRTVKDKNGRPIYTFERDAINGYPVLINNNMDQLQTTTGPVTRKTVAFGNFRKYVVRRAPLLVLRLDERFIDYGQVAFIAYRRVDGNLIDGGGGAVKVLQNVY